MQKPKKKKAAAKPKAEKPAKKAKTEKAEKASAKKAGRPAKADKPAKAEKPAKKKKDPNAPKRALSAFMYFSNDQRSKVCVLFQCSTSDFTVVCLHT